MHTVAETDDSDDLSETFFIKRVSCDENNDSTQPTQTRDTGQTVSAVKSDKWIGPLLVNATVVSFRIDTAAKANLINKNYVKTLKVKPKRITNKTTPLKVYNGQPIEKKGGCRLTVKGKQYNLLFVIVSNGHESLRGDKASEDLSLVKRIYSPR